MPLNRLHPLDSLFRAATRLGRNTGSNTTTAGDSATTTTTTATAAAAAATATTTPALPSRVTYRPFTADVRAGIERWISDTSRAVTSASPSLSLRSTSDYSAACYAPLSAEVEVVESAASIGSHEEEDEVSSTPFLTTGLAGAASSSSSKGGNEDEDQDEDEEQLTRGRSRTRRGGYGYITIALPALAREDDAFVDSLVSPVSSGSRSSSRVSALSTYEREEQEEQELWEGAEEDEDEEEGGCEIRVTPPSMGSWESERDGDGDGEEIEVEIILQ
ncbi:hypothetical protein F5X96DRAFT_414773 [Biscogniauxia mediterranea]|nr:hypothetical protein F5X96DRAFT_414773 [Biscogniauxia mediterranea]